MASNFASYQLIEPYRANLVPLKRDVTHHEFYHQDSHSSVKTGSCEISLVNLSCPSPEYETKEIKNIYVDSKSSI